MAESSLRPHEQPSLPQYGFGAEASFEALVAKNPFLFRVYTPKTRSPFADPSDPYFIAQKFDELFSATPSDLPKSLLTHSRPTYADVAQHMNWTTKSISPYLSTSFSFIWSVWEALRRYQTNVKHDIHIAIIDAKAVASHSFTALELLQKSNPKQRHKDYWKWYRYAQESQDVLVYAAIPTTAVLASIPLLSIIDKLPSYFLRDNSRSFMKEPSLGRVAWDYSDRKPSFNQFCQTMSGRFLQSTPETRLRDTTVGSVRLAVAFLRPWFHSEVLGDLSAATSKVADLAFVIAQWPGQWWSREHGEIWDLILDTVTILGEEVQEKQRSHISAEASRLQTLVDDLEEAVKAHESRLRAGEKQLKDASSQHVHLATKVEKSIQHDEPPKQTARTTTPATPLSPVGASSFLETASCAATGFLVGSFLTLCVLSQRRTIATHFT